MQVSFQCTGPGDYSIPHTHVQRSFTVHANLLEVRILDGQQVLATHLRCWDKGQQIEVQAHLEELVQHKRAGRAHRDTHRLVHAIPQIQTLLNEAAKRGEPLGRIASQLQELLDVHGRTPMTAAVADALHRGVPHPNAVRLALERQRQAQTPPPLGIRANLRPFPPFDLPFRVIFKFKFDGRSALYLPCPFGQASR